MEMIAEQELAELRKAAAERDRLRAAISKHHDQKADDRCRFDDDELYAAAGLPPADARVGDKAAMLENCRRFIERRCESGGWASYRELEAERDELWRRVESLSRLSPLTPGEVAAMASPWVSVSERLPEKELRVLTSGRYGVRMAKFWGRGWHDGQTNLQEGDVDHWMPIPAPPKE